MVKCADDSNYESWKNTLAGGEGWMEIPVDLYNSFDSDDINGNTLDIYIASILGEPKSDSCAVVDGLTGEVIIVLAADPKIDERPDGWLIQDSACKPGDIYDFETASVVTE